MPYKYNPISGQLDYYEKSVGAIKYPSGSVQTFLQASDVTIQTAVTYTGILFGYFVTIFEDTEISEMFVSISAPQAGNSIYGIYTVNDAGYPDTKIHTTPVFDNSLANKQAYVQNKVLPAGNYFLAQSTSSAPIFRSFGVEKYANTTNKFGITDGANYITGLQVPYVYNGTLPATFPAGATTTSPSLPYILFTIA